MNQSKLNFEAGRKFKSPFFTNLWEHWLIAFELLSFIWASRMQDITCTVILISLFVIIFSVRSHASTRLSQPRRRLPSLAQDLLPEVCPASQRGQPLPLRDIRSNVQLPGQHIVFHVRRSAHIRQSKNHWSGDWRPHRGNPGDWSQYDRSRHTGGHCSGIYATHGFHVIISFPQSSN